MVAVSILSISVLMIFQLFSLSLRTIKKSEDHSKALIYARSLMDEAYALPELADGTETFDLKDAFSAVRTITLNSSQDKVKIYAITVAISWPPSGSLELKGLKTYYDEKE